MNDVIAAKLAEIEANEKIKILYAAESGSRAWGFASPDSDYDVRFIYVRPKDFYLRLDKPRDVVEQSVNDQLDINGWDLNKALRLLHNANPTLIEWFSSPIVYRKTDFFQRFQPMIGQFFSKKHSLYHYMHMAERDYHKHLGEETIKVKKYFYMLRPLLACKWILDRGTPPPVLFSELMDAELPTELKADVERLLDLKMNAPELKKVEHIPAVDEYIISTLMEVDEVLKTMEDDPEQGWDDLNAFFLAELDQ